MRLNAAVFLACNIFAQVVIHVSATPVPTLTGSESNELSIGTADQADKARKPVGQQQGRKVVPFSFCAAEHRAKCEQAPEDPTFETLLVKIVNLCVVTDEAARSHSGGPTRGDRTGERVQAQIEMQLSDHIPSTSTYYDFVAKNHYFMVYFKDALTVEGKGVAKIEFGPETGSYFQFSVYKIIWNEEVRERLVFTGFSAHDDKLMTEIRQLLEIREPVPGCGGCTVL
ncbi:hypothetical protein FB446DRAFT_749671 [Lentinula raphanica]|nr:hypothetical protein FB446DRAFT_749671 [Lentinula raphanica]